MFKIIRELSRSYCALTSAYWKVMLVLFIYQILRKETGLLLMIYSDMN